MLSRARANKPHEGSLGKSQAKCYRYSTAILALVDIDTKTTAHTGTLQHSSRSNRINRDMDVQEDVSQRLWDYLGAVAFLQ
eukprot:6274963-Amphidinium_carterae.1